MTRIRRPNKIVLYLAAALFVFLGGISMLGNNPERRREYINYPPLFLGVGLFIIGICLFIILLVRGHKRQV